VAASPELLQRALKKIRPDSPDVTRAAKRLERAKRTLVKIRQKEIYFKLPTCSFYSGFISLPPLPVSSLCAFLPVSQVLNQAT